MKAAASTLVLLCLTSIAIFAAAEDKDAPKTDVKKALRTRIAEDAKKQPAAPPAKATPASAPAATPEKPAMPPSAAAAGDAAKDAAKTPASTNTPATLLPQVEVRKDRITELDRQLAKQEQDIARERKNLKVTEPDLALNDLKVAKPLAIFGGESAQFRQRVAAERVELMEAEKDVLEALGRARNKEERDRLQKELDQLRAMRRDLEKTLR